MALGLRTIGLLQDAKRKTHQQVKISSLNGCEKERKTFPALSISKEARLVDDLFVAEHNLCRFDQERKGNLRREKKHPSCDNNRLDETICK